MKKKDIIGVLSETITRGDLNEFFDKTKYLFGVLSGDFNVRKYEEQEVVEALATVRVLLQAIIAKLGYTKKVSKAEEKLILDIIKANIVSSDKDDKEGSEDFDVEGFDDKEGLEDNEVVQSPQSLDDNDSSVVDTDVDEDADEYPDEDIDEDVDEDEYPV